MDLGEVVQEGYLSKSPSSTPAHDARGFRGSVKFKKRYFVLREFEGEYALQWWDSEKRKVCKGEILLNSKSTPLTTELQGLGKNMILLEELPNEDQPKGRRLYLRADSAQAHTVWSRVLNNAINPVEFDLDGLAELEVDESSELGAAANVATALRIDRGGQGSEGELYALGELEGEEEEEDGGLFFFSGKSAADAASEGEALSGYIGKQTAKARPPEDFCAWNVANAKPLIVTKIGPSSPTAPSPSSSPPSSPSSSSSTSSSGLMLRNTSSARQTTRGAQSQEEEEELALSSLAKHDPLGGGLAYNDTRDYNFVSVLGETELRFWNRSTLDFYHHHHHQRRETKKAAADVAATKAAGSSAAATPIPLPRDGAKGIHHGAQGGRLAMWVEQKDGKWGPENTVETLDLAAGASAVPGIVDGVHPTASVTCACLAPTGARLAIGSSTNVVALYRLEKDNTAAAAAATAATANTSTHANSWVLETEFEGHLGAIEALAFRDASNLISACDQGDVCWTLWDSDGEVRDAIDIYSHPVLSSGKEEVTAMATGGGSEHRLNMWLCVPAKCRDYAVSTSAKGSVHVYSFSKRQTQMSRPGLPGTYITCVTVSPDGTFVAMAGIMASSSSSSSSSSSTSFPSSSLPSSVTLIDTATGDALWQRELGATTPVTSTATWPLFCVFHEHADPHLLIVVQQATVFMSDTKGDILGVWTAPAADGSGRPSQGGGIDVRGLARLPRGKKDKGRGHLLLLDVDGPKTLLRLK